MHDRHYNKRPATCKKQARGGLRNQSANMSRSTRINASGINQSSIGNTTNVTEMSPGKGNEFKAIKDKPRYLNLIHQDNFYT